MNALPLENATRRLGAPAGWDHSQDGICHTLEICDRDGWMISAWLPTPEELAKLAAGAPVILHLQGTLHPATALSVADRPPGFKP